MSKCKLGPKKIRQIEHLTGKKVISAYTRGGWPHFYAQVWFKNEDYEGGLPPLVNYKTGEYLKKIKEEALDA